VPVQWHFDAAMRVELWVTPPDPDLTCWDHMVELDLALSDDGLHFQGPTHDAVSCPIPRGLYRIRIAGHGYGYGAAAKQLQGGPDSYRAQLWPQRLSSAPRLLKDWPDWRE